MKTFKKIFKPLTLKEIGKKVTSQIIECLKNGTIPWKSGLLGQASSMVNCNGVAYRGVNQWLTISKAILEGYKSNRWITFNQCRKEGGSIVKGSKVYLLLNGYLNIDLTKIVLLVVVMLKKN